MEHTIKLIDFGGTPYHSDDEADISSSDNTEAFKKAIQYLKESGGGKLVVGKGVWKTGSIQLFSKITLELEEGCVISFIPDPEKYPPVLTRWEGVVCYAMQSCIFCDGEDHVAVTGKGVIDGSGQVWWNLLKEKKKQRGPVDQYEKQLASLNPGYEKQPGGGGGRNTQFLRPSLVQFHKCTNVIIEGVTLQNSPFWTLHPVFCNNLTVRDVTITNPSTAPNTDGMDIDSCENVLIDSCRISVGDDGIAVKSGSGDDGIKVNIQSKNILIKGCTVTSGHGGVVFGSETAAGISHVRVEDCRFEGTDRGIRIKTRRKRGGEVHNLEFKNLIMNNNLCPIAINMYYRCGSNGTEEELFSRKPLPVESATPSVHDIYLENISSKGSKASAGFIAGLPEMPVRNLIIKDSYFSTDEKSTISPSESDMYAGLSDSTQKSFRILYAENPVFENVKIEGPQKDFIFE